MPGWLVRRDQILYSISRSNFTGPSDPNGGLFAFEAPANGPLKQISNATTGGLGGVAFDISPDGKSLASANIDGSSVSIHPVSKGYISFPSLIFHYTIPHPGPGANGSQVTANPHEAVFTPSGKHMVVCDRGSDRIYAYRHNSAYDMAQVANISVEAGTGPRHAIFRQYGDKTFMYMVSELDNSVRTYVLDESCEDCQSQLLILQERRSTIGPDVPRTPPNNTNLASELEISADGRFMYISNRNVQFSVPSDTVAVFGIDNGKLEWLGENKTYGKIPRHFSLSPGPENDYLAVANEVTQNIEIMKRDHHTGFLGVPLGQVTLGLLDVSTTKGPAAVIWGGEE
ncbi:hypothetical protein MMC13_007430 [Lambiella insularis]|nr:hypothetical protein [Lambiella insularis]